VQGDEEAVRQFGSPVWEGMGECVGGGFELREPGLPVAETSRGSGRLRLSARPEWEMNALWKIGWAACPTR
jgi:hypothetical protein